jgi:sugar phosphate permease
LGTFSGIIDGVASLGSVFGQTIVSYLVDRVGWKGLFFSFVIFTAIGGLPSLSFIKWEYRKMKEV